MDKKNVLIATGILAATGCGATIYSSIKKRKQDKLTSDLIKELTIMLKPATSGLLSEVAFDVKYAERVINGTGRQIITLKNEVAKDFAEQIHGAWGTWLFGSNKQKVFGVFQKLKDKVQVSQVASAYLLNHKVDLRDTLHEKLSSKDIGTILNTVTPLPPYRSI